MLAFPGLAPARTLSCRVLSLESRWVSQLCQFAALGLLHPSAHSIPAPVHDRSKVVNPSPFSSPDGEKGNPPRCYLHFAPRSSPPPLRLLVLARRHLDLRSCHRISLKSQQI